MTDDLPRAGSTSPDVEDRALTATRTVHVGDALTWLETQSLGPEVALVTSMPDCSEVPTLTFDGWASWFRRSAGLILEKTHPEGVAIFYQTDLKREGAWVDKAHLVQQGAEGFPLIFHRIVCRAPAGRPTFGRPGFAHLLGFSKERRMSSRVATVDVIPSLGEMTWPRAIGLAACDAIFATLAEMGGITRVVDPFAGVGTVLAAANVHGLSAAGCELSPKRARKCLELTLRLDESGRLTARRA